MNNILRQHQYTKLTHPTEFSYVDIFLLTVYKDNKPSSVKKLGTRKLRFDTVNEKYYYKFNNQYWTCSNELKETE